MLAEKNEEFESYEPESHILDFETGRVSPDKLLGIRDRESLSAFDEINRILLDLNTAVLTTASNLKGISPESLKASESLLDAQEKFNVQLKYLLKTIFSHDMEALQSIYDLKLQMAELAHSLSVTDGALQSIRNSKAYLVAVKGRDTYHKLRATTEHIINSLKTPPEQTGSNAHVAAQVTPAETQTPMVHAGKLPSFTDEHKHFGVEDPYGDVNNAGTAFEIFRNWVTIFHTPKGRFGSRKPLIHDQIPVMYEVDKLFPIRGKRVLEIGPLEGANTKQLVDLGAQEVVGLESNQTAFLKCLIVKNELRLKNVDFVYGDCNEVLGREEFRAQGRYDLCYAAGVLYHMEDPLVTIDHLVNYGDAIFVWSQVATEHTPFGNWVTLSDKAQRKYTGRINVYKHTDALGGVGKYAVWLTKESLEQAFRDRGYEINELGSRRSFKGESVEFLAIKK